MSLRSLALVPLLLVMAGCPAPDPVTPQPEAPKGPFDKEARAAMDKALEEKSSAALIEVFHRYPKLPSGKEALRRAARMMLVEVKEAAVACNEPAAKGALARLAPFTLEDTEINEAYDEMQKQIGDNHVRCLVTKLDDDIKNFEAAWDWPNVFQSILSAKEIDGATLKQRRLSAVARWKTFLDVTVRGVAGGKIALDDKKAQLLAASADEGQMPTELAEEIKKWSAPVHTTVVVFHDMTEGAIVEPPKKYWLKLPSKTRDVGNATAIDGPTIAGGVAFTAVARGKLDGQALLVAGEPKADVVARLASVKLIFSEADTQGAGTKKK